MIPYHPSKGYILNGVAFPNPFKKEVKSLKIKKDEILRVLFVIGINDKITPISTTEQLLDSFEQAGLSISSIKHPGGHSVKMTQ